MNSRQRFRLPAEGFYLEGPKKRRNELLFALDVFFQFIKGFRKLHFVGPCITVFGSARFGAGHPWYEKARAVGEAIARMGFTTMTGGGPGVMEGANRGAWEAGGKSVGCNIVLPHEQHPNPYLHQWVDIKYFFVRKVLLHKYSYAFIVLPGGWGTMDELFETLTLSQTGIVPDFPVVLMGKAYYQPLWNFLEEMARQGTISAHDLRLIKFTDSVTEAMDHIRTFVQDHYKVVRSTRPRWWFLEKT